ncbi:MAG TPA: sialidase family protein [Thermoanaerobaculia bacterium]
MRLRLLSLLLALCAIPAFGQRQLSSGLSDSGLGYNFARSIVAGDSGDVHVVWFDSRVHYRRSLDDGLTWLAPVTLSSPTVLRSKHAAIAAEGSAVYVVWHELQGEQPQVTPRIMFRRSRDRGATWEPEQRLTDPVIHSAHPSIAATNGRVHVTWFDGRHGDELPEIYTRHSRDGGATWEVERRISETHAPSWVSTVESAGLNVYIGWVDYIDGNEEEYLRRSVDGGETWLAAVRLTDDAADSWAPSIALSGSTVHFAWFDRRDAGVTDVDIELKLNEALVLAGLSPTPPPLRDPANYYLNTFGQRMLVKKQQLEAALPQWVAAGGDPRMMEAILTRYYQLEQAWATGWEIYYKRSSDRGESFTADRRLTFAPMPSQRPSIVARGDDVAMVWFDFRDQGAEIYAKLSSDGGTTWSPDLRLTHSGMALLPSLARSAVALHVVWRDARLGFNQNFYQRIPSRRRPARR